MPLSREQQAEIAQARGVRRETGRATVPALEDILYKPLSVLDHGFVRVVDYMGDDGAIVQAARVSYGRGTRQVSEDHGLINYLMRHRHTTPFEMCEIKYHIKLPIFVARQWIRHRTANVNEYSARYSILDKEFYIPDFDYLETRRRERRIEEVAAQGQPDLFPETAASELRDLAAQSKSNRQGREDVLPPHEAKYILDLLKRESERGYSTYRKLLNEDDIGNAIDPQRHGLARELARIVLSANVYTQWYWKTDLHNLLHFLSLRADPHAQYEIRAYAETMLETVKRWVPIVYGAFLEYRLNAATISATGLTVIRRMLNDEKVDQLSSGLSLREWRELMAVLGR
ncbi:MAG: FAD-dependent thymidylate synthase [Alphaproteobacteria bacterium]